MDFKDGLEPNMICHNFGIRLEPPLDAFVKSKISCCWLFGLILILKSVPELYFCCSPLCSSHG